MVLCYLPHFITAPWWLGIFILAAMGYRLLADYYAYPLVHQYIRLLLIILCLVLLKIQYGHIVSSGFFIGFLLTFVGLKIIELHSVRDLKVVVFCNFYLIFTALIMIQELWILLYLVICLFANYSLMLQLTAPQASLRQIGGRSMRHVLLALPLSLILFYVFPRIANPLWQVPSLNQNHLSFSEQMNPSSITDLFNDDSTAFNVTFKNKPILNGYWRGLVLSFYNGSSWYPDGYNEAHFPPLKALAPNAVADYEILLEPHQKKWLFYSGYPVAARPNLFFSSAYGLVTQNKELITQRFSYALTIQAIPYRELNKLDRFQNTQLPNNKNPRLTAWAKKNYARLNQDPKAFVLFLHQYIKEQAFWYTLAPPALNVNEHQMDYFWFETQKGFCEHYASAVTVILRSLGIPAHVIIGYQGGEWNPLGQYLNMPQNNAHAWLEYWQDGVGWQELDPTAFIAKERIDQRIRDHQSARLNSMDYTDVSRMPWLQRSRLYIDSLCFFTERWLLFYNQDSQNNLLQILGLTDWGMRQLLPITVGFFVFSLMGLGLYYRWKEKRIADELLIEYHLLQREFRRLDIATKPSSTLTQLCQDLSNKQPQFSSVLTLFLHRYEQLRLQQVHGYSKENKKETLALFKSLRRKLSL
jgi:hypothetical protein